MDSMDEIKQTFFQECEDLLEEMESGLVEMAGGNCDSETVNAVFRAVHSVKGGAGAFGLEDLVKFAHVFETTLDEIRADRLEATADVMKVLLRSADVLADLVNCAISGAKHDDQVSAELVNELSMFAGLQSKEEKEQDSLDFEPLSLDLSFDDDDDDFDLGEGHGIKYAVIFAPTAELYASANEAVVLLRNLAELGEAEVECDTSNVPLLDEIDPEGAYFSWNILLETERSEDELINIFDFVDDCCTLNITISDDEEDNAELNKADVIDGLEALNDDELQIVGSASEDKDSKTTAIEPAVKKVGTAKTEKAGSTKAKTSDATIRISLDRVDRLVNLVGEMVINQAMVAQVVVDAGIARDDAVEQGLEELKQLTREIQESVMGIRAQPVKTLFQRMSRIVREAANATQKNVRLITEGEATEVDKTVIERLADPLTHMIRNAVDHGLETPEERVAKGKSAEGIVSLTAAHRSGRVIITVSDDGAGINRDRVKQIAIDKNLIDANAQLTDNEIDNLLFKPGFSTVEEVSTLSGRGVGMDVVKRAIQSVGGKVSISSKPGKGSTFSISLPLTLAVVDGMVVKVAGQTLVVPLTAITETLKPYTCDVHEIGDGGRVISIRGDFIPLVDIAYNMGYRSQPTDLENAVVLSIETEDQQRMALVVDGIFDQRQVVIKSLAENYGHVSGIAAATILGDGRIALILDTEDFVSHTGKVTASDETRLLAVG